MIIVEGEEDAVVETIKTNLEINKISQKDKETGEMTIDKKSKTTVKNMIHMQHLKETETIMKVMWILQGEEVDQDEAAKHSVTTINGSK